MRLLRKQGDVPKRSLWERIKDVAMMDVGVLVRGGVSPGWLEQLEQLLLEADFGVPVTLLLVEEVERKGRSLTGRPHFARVMVEKGYVPDMETAFREYLDESARAYVERQDPQLSQSIARLRQAGGIPSLAHPVRIFRNDYDKVDALIREMIPHGLTAIEAYHSDHKPADVRHYNNQVAPYSNPIAPQTNYSTARYLRNEQCRD